MNEHVKILEEIRQKVEDDLRLVADEYAKRLKRLELERIDRLSGPAEA